MGSDAARQTPIGVFDSGVGGLSILEALRSALPSEDFVYLADTAFAPYGERGNAYVIERTRAIVQQLQGDYAPRAGPGVRLIDTGEPVARQTRRLLEAAGQLRPAGAGRVDLLSTGSLPALQAAATRWLGL